MHLGTVRRSLLILMSASLAASPVMADVLVIHPDGSTRASGWTFHDQKDGPEPVQAETRREAPRARATVLAAITATSDRHQNNRALAASGLNTDEWHSLFRAMIEAESAYNPTVISPVGAYGLGQLMPATARSLGVDRRDITQNLDGAARYLLAQLAAFQNIALALAAYNAGPHRVVEYQGIPPFSETRAYIARVNQIRVRLAGTATPNSIVQATREAPTVWPVLVLNLN